MSLIKETIAYYKELKRKDDLKRRLIKNPLDYDYLQMMIDEVESKNVEIDITLADHTKLIIKPIKTNKPAPFVGD